MTTKNTFTLQLVLEGLSKYKADLQQVMIMNKELTAASKNMSRETIGAFTNLSAASTAALTSLVTLGGAAAAALIGVGAAATKVGATYEKGLAKVGAISQTSVKDLGQLDKAIKQTASYSNTAIEVLNEAAASLAQGDVSIQDISTTVLKYTDYLYRASAGELDMAKAAQLVAGSMSTFNIKGEQVFRIVNSIAAAATKSAVTFSDVERSFRQAITVTGLLGYTVEETAALTGTLGRNFLRGSDAGTSFKQMLLQLVKPSKQILEFMKEYNISLFDASGRSLEAREVVAQLQREFGKQAIATGKITEAERERALAIIFGSDAVRAAIALAEQGVETYDKLFQATKETSAMQMALAQTQDILIPQWEILKNNAKIFAIEMTSTVVPAITSMIKAVTGLVKLLQTSALPKLLGETFNAFISGKGFDQIKLDAVFAFGPEAETMFIGFVNMIKAVRDAVTKDLIPAFQYLFTTITGGGLQGASNIFNTIASAIRAVSYAVSVVVVSIANIIQKIRESQSAMQIFSTVMTGIKASPFILIAAILAPLALTIGKMAVAAYALGAALEWIAANPTQAVQAAKVAMIALGVAISVWTIPYVVTLYNQFKFLAVIAGGPVVTALRATITAITALGAAIIATTIKVVALSSAWIIANAGTINFGAAIAVLASRLVALVAGFIATTGAIVFNVSIWIAAQASATAAWLRGIAAMTMALTGSLVKTLIYVSGVVLTQSGIWIAAQSRMAAASVKAATIIAVAWVGTALRGFLVAIGGMLAAVAPFIVGIMAIAAAAAAVAIAWSTNWNNIQGITQRVINIVVQKIQDFLNFLKSIPWIGEFFTGIGEWAGSAGEQIGVWADNAQTAIKGVADAAGAAFPDVRKLLDGTAFSTKELDDILLKIEEDTRLYNIQNQITENDMKRQLAIQEALNKAREEGDRALRGEQEGGLWFPPETGKDEGTEKAKTDVKEIANMIWSLLKDLPAVTKEVAEYLADIVKDFPERLLPMVNTLRSSRDILGQMVVAKYDLLLATQAVEEADRRIAEYDAKITRLDLQMKIISLGYEKQLLDIRHQINAIDQQMYPLKDRIAAIDREITALQKENLQYVKERAQIELSILPQRQRIQMIDKLIKETGKEDYANTIKQLELQLQMLPLKNQIYEIDRKISQIEDKRLTLNMRLSELMGEQQVSDIEFNLKGVERKLEKAWETMDVKTILDLEAQKEALTKQLDPAKEQLDLINKTQEDTKRYNEIASIGYEQQRLTLELLLDPMQYQLELLKQQEELRKLTNDLIIANYNLEKAAIEASIKSQTDRIFAIEQLAEAEKVRNAVAIVNLQIEREQIEALLLPLELQRQALERIQTQINLNLADAIYAFEVEKVQYELLKAEEELRRIDLEDTRVKQAEVFDELTLAFVEAMVNSGNFTLAEAIEVASRMKMWSDQAQALAEVRSEFSRIKQEAWAVRSAIDAIPKDVVITITTVHKDIYEGNGRASGGPVLAGQLYKVGERGTEAFVPDTNGYIIPNNILRSFATTMRAPSNMSGMIRNSYDRNTNVNNTYNVNASYASTQSPANIGMDLRAISAMTRR